MPEKRDSHYWLVPGLRFLVITDLRDVLKRTRTPVRFFADSCCERVDDTGVTAFVERNDPDTMPLNAMTQIFSPLRARISIHASSSKWFCSKRRRVILCESIVLRCTDFPDVRVFS